VQAVLRLWKFYPGICLTTEEKVRKDLSQGKKNLSRFKKTLSQGTDYILTKHPHITKSTHTHTQNTHIHTHTQNPHKHTHTNTTQTHTYKYHTNTHIQIPHKYTHTNTTQTHTYKYHTNTHIQIPYKYTHTNTTQIHASFKIEILTLLLYCQRKSPIVLCILACPVVHRHCSLRQTLYHSIH
jgi:hypothetical protein